MDLYKEEKQKLGSMRWGIVAGILIFFSLHLQCVVTLGIELEERGHIADAVPMPYPYRTLLLGILILVFYLNSKLFFVEEQGKRVYLLKKYEILPIRIRTFYQVKIRIMAETILVLIGGSIPLYYLVVVVNHQRTSLTNVLMGAVGCMVFAIVFMTMIILILDISQEVRGRKR